MQMIVCKIIKEEVKRNKQDYKSINLEIFEGKFVIFVSGISNNLHAIFGCFMSIFGQMFLHESCRTMSLESTLKISTIIDQ